MNLRSISESRRIENRERRKIMALVRERDMDCIGKGRIPNHQCHGPLNGHEVISRAQGGSITDPRNIILLCNLANEWVDLNHDEAIKLGFRQIRTDPYSPKVAARLPQYNDGERLMGLEVKSAEVREINGRPVHFLAVRSNRDLADEEMAAQFGIPFRGTCS